LQVTQTVNSLSIQNVTAETGWVTAGDPGVPAEDRQGKLFLNFYLDASEHGWSGTFEFAVWDEKPKVTHAITMNFGAFGRAVKVHKPTLARGAALIKNLDCAASDTFALSDRPVIYEIAATKPPLSFGQFTPQSRLEADKPQLACQFGQCNSTGAVGSIDGPGFLTAFGFIDHLVERLHPRRSL
jgi:hypothetical protein